MLSLNISLSNKWGPGWIT